MIIKDEVFGTIEFGGLEEKIIDSRDFQRLRRIKQMSFTNLVYPGANHTRFEHSLGTAHLASMIAKRLGFEDDDVKKIKLYGLLHDVGHVAFSHEGEDVLAPIIGNHEALGKNKMRKGEIGDILKENYAPEEIINIEKSAGGDIITSDIGADRMDYLKRDALNTGVAYGIIDIDRIIHTLSVENGKLHVRSGGLEAAEYLLVARFIMFSAVYLHKTVRIATAMLHKAIENSIGDGTLRPGEFGVLDDEGALFRMRESESARKYVDGLVSRNLYKEVTSVPCEKMRKEETGKIQKELSDKFESDIIVDYPYRFSQQADFLVKTSAGLKPISRVSELVQSLEKAGEARKRILILAEENVRKKFGERIAASV